MDRYRYLLSTLKRDKKNRFHTIDVMKLLRKECERSEELIDEIHKLKAIIERANAMIIAQREGRREPKCKVKSTTHRTPAVVMRSVKAALAR